MQCPKCQNENRPNAAYCSNCGARLVYATQAEDYQAPVKRLYIFFFTLLIYLCIINLTSVVDSFEGAMVAHIILACIVLVFYKLNYKSIAPLYSFKNTSGLVIVMVVLFSVAMAISVHYFAGYINRTILNHTDETYYTYFSESSSPLLMSILFIGVFPAVFEELAFRGILFNELQKITGKWAVIITSSIMFTFMHFSAISVMWLLPGALALGYLRATYNTLNYGMLAHFTYNTCVVVLSMYVPVNG